jgi:hypothetical protein
MSVVTVHVQRVEKCNACNKECKGYTRGECFGCGLPVCVAKSCSRRVNWYRYGRRRICVDCIEQHSRTQPHYDRIWKKTPMPVHYTCGCGIYVHPSRRKPDASHIADCSYARGGSNG